MSPVSMEQVWRDYHDKVSGFVLRKVADSYAAEDIVSDIFIKISSNLDRFDSEKASLSTWVYTISRNTIYDYYRTRKVALQIPDEDGENGPVAQALVDAGELEYALIQEEQLKMLANALKQLPQRSRDLIILRYYSNITLKEAAMRLGMSYANAKIVHKKALNQLEQLLEA